MDLGPIEMAWSTLYHLLQLFRSNRVCNRCHQDGLTNFLLPCCNYFGLTEMLQSVPPKRGLPYHCTSVAPSCFHSVPPKLQKFTSFAQVGLTEISNRCHRVWSKMCNGWISCGGYIYPSTTLLPSKRAIRTCLHFHHTFFEREPPTHVLRSSYSNPTI